MDQKIVHFSHNHPLVLKEQEHNDDGVESSCSGCEKPISASSPAFYCNQCDYILHKSCTKLPHKIKHPEHPEHPLILLPTAPYYSSGYICDLCREIFDSFVYHCSHCEYDLDIACASKYHPDDGHSHEFTSLDDDDDSDSFVCYACGDEATEGSGCLCTVCQIKVHSSCSELPQIVRTKRHHHSLNLTYSLFSVFGLMDEDDITCGACNGKLSSSFGGYFCSICKFATHLKCPENQTEDFKAVTEDDDDEAEHISDSHSQESHVESPETDHHQDQSHRDLDLSKLGHEHLLRFIEELSLQCADKLCDVCLQPITSPLFSCSKSDCGFIVHQSCAELPRKKQHKLHPHPLNLLPKAPPYDGIYRCDGCKFLGNGFVYRCDECQFDLDVFCGSLMDKIQHDSHKHTLLLQRTSTARECRGCSVRSKHVFVCDVCDDFAIDCWCATQPSKVWHIYDKHPLTLIYSAEGDLREYKCGICKEKRSHQKQWFYYCDDCDFGAHTWCVLNKSRRVKFGGTFLYDVLHSHPLALVEEKGKHPPRCEACGEGCKGWTLECGQCKCYFHRTGKCFWEKFKESAKYLALSETMRHKYAANVLASTPNATDK